MSATIHPFAPTAARVTPRAGTGTPAAARGGEGRSSRSAHTDSSRHGALERAVKLMADHGRLVAQAAADGDKARLQVLLIQQGEVLIRAGIQLMREGAP